MILIEFVHDDVVGGIIFPFMLIVVRVIRINCWVRHEREETIDCSVLVLVFAIVAVVLLLVRESGSARL